MDEMATGGKVLAVVIDTVEVHLCSSCYCRPESQGGMVRCSSESCLLRSLIGWSPVIPWNELMDDIAEGFAKEKSVN